MIRGIYSSASSLLTLLRRQETLSHNLANMNTTGFKQEIVPSHETAALQVVQDRGPGGTDPAIGRIALAVNGDNMQIDFSQGPLEQTDRSLDIAILGDGFFQVQTPEGVRLTRDGTFHRDATGKIVTADGYQLLGENGPITLPEGDPYIDEKGNIFMPGANAPAGRIALVRVTDPTQLTAEGGNLYNTTGAQVQNMPAGETRMKQGFVEQANIDLSGTIVGMMMALRSYEATQRSLRMQDETLQKLMDIARTA